MNSSNATNNYPLPTSSPITEALPSPNLTEPSLSSPKVPDNTAAPNPILNVMMRTINNKAKELNITEYSNKELKSMKKRCRTVMTPGQSRILRKVLEQTAFPSTEIRENLAKFLGMKPRTVQIWFQNQRQKSRQGRVSGSTEDLTVGSPDDCGSGSDATDIEDPLSSPYESNTLNSVGSGSSSTTTTSPGFNALTAAAFVLSHNNSLPLAPLDAAIPNPHDPIQANQQRYSTFHGAVYKSVPGCIPVNSYRGNTAAAINAKRMAVSANSNNNNMSNFIPGGSSQFLPNQPQKIPTFDRRETNAIPLDVLASAVSNFRPNGYNYYMQPQQNRQQQQQSISRSIITSPNMQQQPAINNFNRLAPLRTPSPSYEQQQQQLKQSNISVTPVATTETKLPSLKTLAQVASIGIEMEPRPKSNKIPIADEEISNTTAPNSNTTTRRPW